jgi:hypothetical protein
LSTAGCCRPLPPHLLSTAAAAIIVVHCVLFCIEREEVRGRRERGRRERKRHREMVDPIKK